MVYWWGFWGGFLEGAGCDGNTGSGLLILSALGYFNVSFIQQQ